MISLYAAFVSALYQSGGDLGAHIRRLVLDDDNPYVRLRAKGLAVNAHLEACLRHELRVLQSASRLTGKEVQDAIGYDGTLPDWENAKVDLLADYMQRMENVSTAGYGMYAKYPMFRVVGGAITPVKYPDPVSLTDLLGYEAERNAVVNNTLALLRGGPAANVLLYGDAGTGKSSTVKAIVNGYWKQGLRLVQITPEEFNHIPLIVETLNDNPLKFILFIDDLSFAEHNDEFTALKAVLEGSVSFKAPNIAIYATSNRMHLIKESFSDRDDDIHRNETIEELCSLSERFGLSVSFFKPDKKLFLEIVHELKGQYGIVMSDVALDIEAERFAMARGGRSPRAARQFLEHIGSFQT